MKKFFLVLLLACAVLTAALTGCKKEKKVSDDDFVLVIGMGIEGGLCASPFYIALENKLFEAERLNYEIFRMETGTVMNHLTMGTIDVANNLLATVIQPIANGYDIKIPLAVHTGCVKMLTRADSGILSPIDLKGKKIGVNSLNASPKVIGSRVLANVGLKPDGYNADVEWLIFTTAELPLALERGWVDAIGIGDPTASIVEAEGNIRVIINSSTDDYLKDEFCCVVTVRSQTVADHPEAVAKFLRALQKAAYWVQENPEETARIITEKNYVSGEIATNAKVLSSFNYRASVSQARTAIERNARDLQQIGIVAADVDVDALVRDTFVAIPGVPDSLR